MPSQETSILVIAGPTASGKSEAALRLAETLEGEVICADSMQVYRDLRVVTARPDAVDEARAPHRLYGHVDGAERYSAGRFVREAVPAIEGARAAGRVPILCGGTGLYLKALVEGLSLVPDVPDEVTRKLGEGWDEDPAAFRKALLATDPAMERLEPADRQRHLRAAAVLEATGRTLTSWQAEPTRPAVEGPWLPFLLLPEREALYARCDRRFGTMLAEGAAEEVEALLARGLDPALPVMKALGVPELAAAIRGECSLTEAAERARQETRRFAKRQTTWFRNQTAWPRFSDCDSLVKHASARLPPGAKIAKG